MEALGLECTCLGGGKIEHDSNMKKLRVFGESTVMKHYLVALTGSVLIMFSRVGCTCF